MPPDAHGVFLLLMGGFSVLGSVVAENGRILPSARAVHCALYHTSDRSDPHLIFWIFYYLDISLSRYSII